MKSGNEYRFTQKQNVSVKIKRELSPQTNKVFVTVFVTV